MRLQPLSVLAQPHFSGQGHGGKVRLAIAKADYNLVDPNIQRLQNDDRLELVGVATTENDFNALLDQKVDVALMGSTFGFRKGMSAPVSVLRLWQMDHPKEPLPGVVIHSLFSPHSDIQGDTMTQVTSPFKATRHISDKATYDDLFKAIQSVDPHPQTDTVLQRAQG